MKTHDIAVSVIVPTHDSRPGLDALLGWLRAQTLSNELYEVIVVDDGSRDGSAEMVQREHPWVRLIRQRRRGAYHARRTGVEASRGAMLAFTDADCVPSADWLERGLAGVTDERLDLGAGRVDVSIANPGSVVERYDARFNLKQAYYATRAGFGVTANLFVSRAVYQRVGGFNASLYSGGDQKFCHDAITAGARLGYLPAAAVSHPARRTRRELMRKTVRVAKGRAQAFPSPHYYFPRLLSALPAAYGDMRFASEPMGFKLRFIALHYWLEVIRIATYTGSRLQRFAAPASEPVIGERPPNYED